MNLVLEIQVFVDLKVQITLELLLLWKLNIQILSKHVNFILKLLIQFFKSESVLSKIFNIYSWLLEIVNLIFIGLNLAFKNLSSSLRFVKFHLKLVVFVNLLFEIDILTLKGKSYSLWLFVVHSEGLQRCDLLSQIDALALKLLSGSLSFLKVVFENVLVLDSNLENHYLIKGSL